MKKRMRTLPSFDLDRSLQTNPLLAQGTSGTLQETVQETIQETTEKTTEKESVRTGIAKAIADDPFVTMDELAEMFGLTQDGVYYHIKVLHREMNLRRHGSAGGAGMERKRVVERVLRRPRIC